MRGELDKLPKRQLPDRTVGKRSPDDLAKLQKGTGAYARTVGQVAMSR
jgi:hypothetical protein